MSFNYNKHKGDDQGHFWASYSDLLLGMSVVFLLLYVTASVRSGTTGMHQQLENNRLTMQVEDLKNQLKAYESIKQDYLAKEATKDDEQQYMELMDKLTLLQDEAANEAKDLNQKMQEQQKKEKALNQYQQMVRNIINANTLAKTKISKRNTIIKDQDTEISEQDQDIQNLNQQIAENEQQIQQASAELKKKTANLKAALKNNEITKSAYEKQVAALRDQSANKIKELESSASEFRQQLASAQDQVEDLSKDLAAKTSALGDKEREMAELKDSYGKQAARDRAAFEKQMAQERLGAAERAKKEAEFRARAAAKEKELDDKMRAVAGRLKDTEGKLGKLQAEADARRAVADEIRKGFAAQGIKAEIDGESGDVVIDFGENHFANDSSKLKSGMMDILEKAMPTYAKSLLGNPKIANKVTSVEIVGFASPTYKGKFIDPNSEVQRDKEALAYNMDLSYKRAKSIYEYTFHSDRMSFDYQRKMLPLVKVSARSFLEAFDEKRRPANFQEYCQANDCNKARKVMIKFTMDNKK